MSPLRRSFYLEMHVRTECWLLFTRHNSISNHTRSRSERKGIGRICSSSPERPVSKYSMKLPSLNQTFYDFSPLASIERPPLEGRVGSCYAGVLPIIPPTMNPFNGDFLGRIPSASPVLVFYSSPLTGTFPSRLVASGQFLQSRATRPAQSRQTCTLFH